MEENIIEQIAEAEREGAARKSKAEKKAAEIIAEAEKKASEILKKSEDDCKLLREEGLKSATAKAQEEYESELEISRTEAKKYAEERMEYTEVHVCDIVGRLTK